MTKKLNIEHFIESSIKVHQDRYDYSMAIYCGSKIPLTIRCLVHGIFLQSPCNHYKGKGCPKCGDESGSNKRKSNTQDFIIKAQEIHKDKYSYHLTKYGKNNREKVIITCKEHGDFKQSPGKHLSGDGCRKCAFIKISQSRQSNTKEFIEKAKVIHLDKYDYRFVNYENAKKPVIIICQQHGEFKQTPDCHLVGGGCPSCKSSRGEITIASILNKYSLNYKSQARFDSCKDKRPLPFDFLVQTNKKFLIEFNGLQHYQATSWNSSMSNEEIDETFKAVQHRDLIKRQWCLDNNIPLLIIPYWELNKVETIILDFLNKIEAQ